MPAPAGPLVAFLLGVALAWLARAHDDDRVLSPRTAIVALFGALVVAPATAYFLISWGDWAYFYLTDSRSIPSALELVLVLVSAALAPAGFVACRAALRRRSARLLAALALLPSALLVTLIGAFFPRLAIVGTYAQIQGAFGTEPVPGSPLGYAILWMNGLLIAGLVLTARALTGERRAPPPKEPARPAAPEPLLGRRSRR